MKCAFIILILFLFAINLLKGQSVEDIDGNIYTVVNIGEQKWLKENLKTKRFQNGDSIPYIFESSQWKTISSPGYCFFLGNVNTYGNLYNFFVVDDSRNVCPVGWKVPSKQDWLTLFNFVGSSAGGKLKEIGTTHWLTPNSGATDSYSFNGLPGGHRLSNAGFMCLNQIGFFWTSSIQDSLNSWYISLHFDSQYESIYHSKINSGYSIRCIKDTMNSVIETNLNFDLIYPNPTSGKLNIEINYPSLIEVYNIYGEKIINIDISERVQSIDLSDLKTGLYFVSLLNVNGKKIHKIIKE